MDFDSIARSIWNQFVTVWNAPIPFIAALLIAGYFIWKIANWQHSVRIANLNSQLDLYREANAVSAANAAKVITATPSPENEAGLPEQIGLAAPSESEESSAPTERVFIDDNVTIETLRGLFRQGRSTLASQTEAEPLIGKWMKLSGHIANMRGISGGVLVTLKQEGMLLTIPLVNLSFETDTAQLAATEVGEPIHAIGKLHSVEPLSIFFIECELVHPD